MNVQLSDSDRKDIYESVDKQYQDVSVRIWVRMTITTLLLLQDPEVIDHVEPQSEAIDRIIAYYLSNRDRTPERTVSCTIEHAHSDIDSDYDRVERLHAQVIAR